MMQTPRSTHRLNPRFYGAAGMSLIELIGILAVIAIFAVVLLRAIFRETDYNVSRAEKAALRTYVDALQRGIAREGVIPSQNTWTQLVAAVEGVDALTVARTKRGQFRRLLYNTNGWFGSVTLPWVQPQGGSTNLPANARMMLISSLGNSIPLDLQAGPTENTEFQSLWHGTNGFTNGAWMNWKGRPQDIMIERFYVSPLFVAVYLGTSDSPSYGTYSFGTNATRPSAPFVALNAPQNPRYILAGTSLHLFSTNILDSVQILNKDSSFLYERGMWRSGASGGVLPGGVDIAAVVNAFLNAPYNENAYINRTTVEPYPQIQQYVVVDSMMRYMSNYVLWASGTTSTTNFGDTTLYNYLRYNLQPNMMSNIAGLYEGVSANYPTNSLPCQ